MRQAWWRKWSVFFAAAVVCLCVALGASQPCRAERYWWEGDDKWYYDISGTDPMNGWMVPYVESMRQARVVIGHKDRDWRDRIRYWFYPTDPATRSWFGMCLMEILGDLDDYRQRVGNTDWYWDGRRWFLPYANDMLDKGLIQPGTFQDASIRRDEAFAWTIRALDLNSVAQAMSEDEIEYYLDKFSDGWKVDPRYRADMALAIKLGLAKGYEDKTLRPTNYLKRGEGAVIATRLSVVLEVSPTVFRPRNGEVVEFSLDNRGRGEIRDWRLEVAPASNLDDPVKVWDEAWDWPILARWNGRTGWRDQIVCDAGVYVAHLYVQYRTVTGETVNTEGIRKVYLDSRYFDAQPLLSTVVAGAPVYVQAWGSGTARAGPYVTASWGKSAGLSWDGDSGQGSVSLPAETPEGTYRLDFSAVLGVEGLPDEAFSVSRPVNVVQERVFVYAPASFAPGRGEVLPVTASARGYTSAVSWTLAIKNSSGAVVRQYSGSGLPSTLCSWDGRDSSGRRCPSGTYTLALTAVRRADTGKNKYDLTCTASTQVTLDGRVMDASLDPTRVLEGEQVTVSASAGDWAGGAASLVDARAYPSWGGEVVLSGGSSSRSGVITVPPGTAGSRTVEVRGTLGGGGLPQVVVSKVLPLTVDAELRDLAAAPATPQAVAGAVLYVTATTKGDVLQAPVAEGWGQSVPMQQTGGGSAWEKTWRAVLSVPAGAQEGPAEVKVRAQLGQQGAQPKWFEAAFGVSVVRERVDVLVPASFAPVRGGSLQVRCSSAGVTQPVSWTLRVETPSGQLVRQFSGAGQPDPLCTWDGRDGSGAVVAPGSYVLRLESVRQVNTGAGNPPFTLTVSDTAGVIVDGRQLLGAWVEADPAVAGAPLWVDATYAGQFVSGHAEGSWSQSGTLSEASAGRACGQVQVPQTLSPGSRNVTVRVTLRQSGLPDLELTRVVPVEVVREEVTVALPGEIAPRAGEWLLATAAYRGYAAPYRYRMDVESEAGGWARVWSVEGQGLPSTLPPWDGKLPDGRWADPGTYRVRLEVQFDVDVGPGRPPCRLVLSGSCPFQVLGVETHPGAAPVVVRIIR